MICKHISIKPYEFPLVRTMEINSIKLHTRRGLIITLTDSSGKTAQGEISPLPGLHKETLAQALAQVKSIHAEHLNDHLKGSDLFASVRCGLEMACMQMQWPQEEKLCKVKLNALVMAHEQGFIDEALNLADQGYESIKVKVGRQDLKRDIDAVIQLRDRLENRVFLRLDANRGWNMDQAFFFAQQVTTKSIEYIEEPLNTWQDLPEFYDRTGFAFALDETLAEFVPAGMPVISGCAGFILKPAVLGSLNMVLQYIDLAKQRHIAPVLSSVFEGLIALEFYKRLACICHIENTPHGLDTWRWYKIP